MSRSHEVGRSVPGGDGPLADWEGAQAAWLLAERSEVQRCREASATSSPSVPASLPPGLSVPFPQVT